MRRGRTLPFPTLSPRACAAVAVFTLYLATATHDVGGPGLDAAKFGYMSRILGVPHAPGYPLYMMVGWLWSWLPIGTLIFRMSAFSAACGAVTVWLVAVLLELLGCTPLLGAGIAFIGGAGRIFWSQSIIPEVYTLHTALLLSTMVWLVAWKRSGDVRMLYLASLAFGLDLAHHTDVAVFAPAILVFVVAVDAQVVTSPRIVMTAAALVLSPLALYAYIPVRTTQGAEYVEAGATSLSGLVGVISGRQFGYLLFRGSVVDAVRDRWRDLGRFFTAEMGVWGCALALVGLVVLWRRDRHASALVGLGALGMLAFVLNYYPPDIEVFLLPVFLMCWVAIGVGVDALRRLDLRLQWPVAASLAAWASWQVGANVTANNLRPASHDARMLNRLFQEMPAGAAIVGDTIDLSQAILYKLFAEPDVARKRPTLVVPGEFGATRVFGFVRSVPDRPVVPGDPASLDRLVAERPAVYAFARLADPLRAQGFRLDPVQLRDRPLAAFLAGVPRGAMVAAALPAAAAARLLTAREFPFRALGAEDRVVSNAQCFAVLGIVGDARGATASAAAVGRVEIRKGQPVGAARQPAPVDVVAECGTTSASITVGGHEIAASSRGAPIVVFDKRGEVADQTLASPSMDYAVPFEWRWQPVYRVAAPRRCVAVSRDETDVIGPASQAGLAVYLPRAARLSLLLGSDVPLRVRSGQFSRRPASLHVAPASPPATMTSQAPIWTRVDVEPASANDDDVIDVVLGVSPRVALASIDRDATAANVCAATLGNFPVLAGTLDGFERVMADGSREEIFGDGWHGVEEDERGGFRWTASPRAHVLVPMAHLGRIQVGVRARQPPGAGDNRIGLTINGRRFDPLPMADGWGTYQWTVDADVWRDGVNDLALESPRVVRPPGQPSDTRLLGVAVREIVFQVVE